MTREEMIAVVTARMAGSPEAQPHTHIECFCPGFIHRRDDYDEGCFCPGCAAKAAVALGYPPTDIEHDNPWGCTGEGDVDDAVRWCETCGALMSAEINEDAAEDELLHWETPRETTETRCGGPPSTAVEWREFLLTVKAIDSSLLPRAWAIIELAAPTT